MWPDPHQWQSVREDVVSDVVSSDGQLVQRDWITVLQGHPDLFEVSVHSNINTRDGAVHLGNSYVVTKLLFIWENSLTWVPFFNSMVTVS